MFGSNGGFNASAGGRSFPDLFSSTPRASDAASSTASTGGAFAGFGSGSGRANAAPSFGSTSIFGISCSDVPDTTGTCPTNVPQQPEDFKKVVTSLMNKKDNLKKRISFLSGFIAAFKQHVHTDIQLRPNDGPCIPAHKALLATRSEVFKNILGSDGCKVAPADSDAITMSELNTEELVSLLEFLYTGNLPFEKLEKHVYSLYTAADKYEIPYLHESCETYMRNSLNTSNALDILEISDSHSSKTLKEIALNFIVGNMKDIVSTHKYEDFASSNPNLCVQITRTFVDAKCK